MTFADAIFVFCCAENACGVYYADLRAAQLT
jgi:hypothetical protein